MVFYNEKMPQTVPSNEFNSSAFDYSTDFIADSFDLSLLPSNLDSQVPGSGQNLQQIFSFYSENSCLPMFPNTTIEKESDMMIKSEPSDEITCGLILSIKKEPNTSEMLPSPGLDSFSSLSSYTSSPSPPFQQCPASPEITPVNPLLQSFKQEVALNIQDILDELRLAQRQCLQDKKKEISLPLTKKMDFESAVPQPVLEKDREAAAKEPAEDHRLLREVLKDTSFQKKYHLRPFDIGDFGTAFQPEGQKQESAVDVEIAAEPAKMKTGSEELAKDNIFGVDLSQEGIGPVFSLALEQLKKDVHSTSTILGISRDPVQWSEEDVKCWVLWNLRQYNLPLSSADFFNVKGSELVTLSEEKFQEISSQSGSLLHAQLEIWKAVCLEDTHLDVSNLLYDSPASQSNSSSIEMTDEEDEEEEMVAIESIASPRASGGGKMTGRGSGSHIHLWQFLKELLASPQAHCSCIRWLDRSKGVFKIEDSVKVARLWGMRKNRPAMNYDKLSRSIRQYYKKGIMKKTERSQRLVYQFCHPYSL